MTEKLYSKLTKSECLDWLKRNDQEYNWSEKKLTSKELRDVIADNLHSFGQKSQSDGLKARFSRRSEWK